MLNNKSQSPNIFIVWSDKVNERIDPYFHLPKFEKLYEQIKKCKNVQKLKEVVKELDYGLMPTQDYAESERFGVPMIRVTNITPDGTIDMADVKYIPFDTPRLDVKRVKENDILMVQCGSTTGKVALMPKQFENYTFGSFSFVIRGKKDLITQEYLFAVLISPMIQDQIKRTWNIVTVRPNTSKPAVENLLIPVPSLSVQKKIGDFISNAYEEKRQKEQEIKAILASIDGYVLGELGIVTERERVSEAAPEIYVLWNDEIAGRIDPFFYKPYLRNLLSQIMKQKHYKLGDVMVEMSGGATPRVTENYYLDEGGVPFLRVQNITEMGLNLDDVKFIKPEVHETMLKRSQLRKDDLVFTITGRIGSVAVIPENFEGNINQHSVRFHLRDKITETKIMPEYVAVFFNTQVGRDLSFRSTTGGTRPALDYEALKNLVFPLPNEVKQEKIVNGVKSYYAKIKGLQQEAAGILAGAQKQAEKMILA